MRRFGLVAGIILAGGLYSATATAATRDVTHMLPAPTSVDRSAVSCVVPPAPVIADPVPGSTVITFTILPRSCRP